MACNCRKGTVASKFEYTSADGKKTTYTSEVQAQAAKIRSGGSYRKIAG